MTDYKEKIEIYTKYLEKKSNLVGSKYLRLHRWISHIELSIFQVWTLVLQLGGDSATWRWFAIWRWFATSFAAWRPLRGQGPISRPFCSPFYSCEMRGLSCEMELVCQWVVSQLRNTLRNFRSSIRSTLCGCFQLAITSSFQLQFTYRLKRWTPDFPRFKTRYSMHEMDSRKYSKCVQQFLSSWILHVRFLSFSSLHSWLALAKNYEAPKLEFFM